MDLDTDIYGMRLHEIVHYNSLTQVLRVPGGWIYHSYDVAYDEDGDPEYSLVSATFVPFDNEFKPPMGDDVVF